jgi:hypothetical protein
MCVANGWDLIYSDNHWPNFDTTKRFVENVMVFHHQAYWIIGITNTSKTSLGVRLLECTQKSRILGLDFFLIQIY